MYLVCRNPERGEEAKREIIEISKNEVRMICSCKMLHLIFAHLLPECRVAHSGPLQAQRCRQVCERVCCQPETSGCVGEPSHNGSAVMVRPLWTAIGEQCRIDE